MAVNLFNLAHIDTGVTVPHSGNIPYIGGDIQIGASAPPFFNIIPYNLFDTKQPALNNIIYKSGVFLDGSNEIDNTYGEYIKTLRSWRLDEWTRLQNSGLSLRSL